MPAASNRCPHCDEPLLDPGASECPHCGQRVRKGLFHRIFEALIASPSPEEERDGTITSVEYVDAIGADPNDLTGVDIPVTCGDRALTTAERERLDATEKTLAAIGEALDAPDRDTRELTARYRGVIDVFASLGYPTVAADRYHQAAPIAGRLAIHDDDMLALDRQEHALLRLAAAAHDALGQPIAAAAAFADLADRMRTYTRLDDAEAFLNEALERCEQTAVASDTHDQIERVAEVMCDCVRDLEVEDAAAYERRATEAVQLCVRHGHPVGATRVLCRDAMPMMTLAAEDAPLAHRLADAAMAVADAHDAPHGRAIAWSSKGAAFTAESRPDAALDAFGRAVSLYRDLRMFDDVLLLFDAMAGVEYGRDNLAAVVALYADAVAVAEACDDPDIAIHFLECLASAHRDSGQHDDARRVLTDARDRVLRGSSEYDVAYFNELLADLDASSA